MSAALLRSFLSPPVSSPSHRLAEDFASCKKSEGGKFELQDVFVWLDEDVEDVTSVSCRISLFVTVSEAFRSETSECWSAASS